MSGDSTRSLEEKEGELNEAQRIFDSAKGTGKDFNQGHPFVNLTLKLGVQVFGSESIEQVTVWDQTVQHGV